MRIGKSFGKRKYFAKIAIWISTAVFLVTVVLSGVVYYNAQSILVKKEYEADRKILYQVQNNIELMDNIIGNLTKYLFVNEDVAAVMYAGEENMLDISVRMTRISSSFIAINPYIHSICIYNGKINQIYSVGESFSFKEQNLSDLFASGKVIPKLKPVSIKIEKVVNSVKETEDMISYFMYESTNPAGKLDGAIIVNIRPEWLLENIKKINMIGKGNADSIFILDANDEFILDGKGNEELKKLLKTEYKQYRDSTASDVSSGFFRITYNGIKSMVTFTCIESAGMTLLKIQPVDEVFMYINSLRTSIIVITIIFLFIALGVSLSISHRIYSPLGNLVKSIISYKETKPGEDGIKDEISYLSSVYKQSMEKISIHDQERYKYMNVVKYYWLNRLLTESFSVDKAELEGVLGETSISLKPGMHFVVCVLKIDRYRELQQENSLKDLEILRFAVINICTEIVSESYANEGIDMKSDHVVLILGVPEDDDSYTPRVVNHIRKVQEYVKQYFSISFSASISEKTGDIKDVSSLYNASLENSVYRFMFGEASVITPENIRINLENKRADYSRGLEGRLIESIKAAKRTEIEECLNGIFKEISGLSYNNAVISLIKLAGTIKKALEETMASANISSYIDFPSINMGIIEKEISEIHREMLKVILESIEKDRESGLNSKNLYVVDAVRDYININYYDKSLCLAQIASLLKISSRQLSKIFRESTQVSIPDYINEVRLVKAAEMLANKEWNVYAVIEKVGIENDTYFYGMFKKRFGVTPKEYALQANLENVKK